jgi:hypothetical protein
VLREGVFLVLPLVVVVGGGGDDCDVLQQGST